MSRQPSQLKSLMRKHNPHPSIPSFSNVLAIAADKLGCLLSAKKCKGHAREETACDADVEGSEEGVAESGGLRFVVCIRPSCNEHRAPEEDCPANKCIGNIRRFAHPCLGRRRQQISGDRQEKEFQPCRSKFRLYKV